MNFKRDIIDFRLNSVKVLEVLFKHDFFDDGYFKKIEIIPSVKTRITLKNHNLVFKRTVFGFVIIFNEEERFFSPLFSNELKLEFEFKILDNQFLNYTNIPFNYNQLFVFSNDYISNKLHINEYVDSTTINETNKNGLTGLIELKVNKNNEIFSKKNSNYIPNIYEINYKSRHVLFRYNFYSDEHNFEFKNYYLANENNSIKISDYKHRILETGLKVFSMVFQAKKKMKEKYLDPFYLIRHDELFKHNSLFLPYPDLKNISYDKENNIFFNDVFIKI